MAPHSQKIWQVQGTSGFDALNLDSKGQVPEVGDNDVLVKRCGASLNYRDLIIPSDKYPYGAKSGVVPGSDGFGIISAIGSAVTRFKKGDKVVTLFNQGHLGGSLNLQSLVTGLGGSVDGTLREYGAFNEEGLVHMPESLSFLEASTLTCAELTAWSALYGLESRVLEQGDVVLTSGTGGVSLFAVQFAKSAGATMISTTSSSKKAEMLKNLGTDHVINYKEDSNWGEIAKKYTPNNEGVKRILEVGGPTTMKQSLTAIKIDGVISIIGFLGGMKGEAPGFLDCLANICTVRGVLVGNRIQFEEMNRAVEANGIKPVVDPKTFALDELKDAYQHMWDQKHLGKVCIKIGE